VLIAELVKNKGHLLTAIDRKLVALLQAQPAEAAFWLASDLTQPLGLHQSAATRLAQRLGFAGYPELRSALRQDYLAGAGPSQRLRGRLDRHVGDEVLQSFVDDEMEALAALPQHVSQAQLDGVAARLTSAEAVYLFGQGNATILVEQLSRRLQRFGIRPVALVGSRRDIAERVATLGAHDLLIAFAFRRVPGALGPLIDLANSTGTDSVVITDTLLSMSPAPTTILAAPRGGSDEFLSLTVPMAIANALVLTMGRTSPDTTLRSLDRLDSLFDHFDV
jgi:DNA-binding MurR/RpiR family transcriptional regulator